MEKEIELKFVEETLKRYGARLQGILIKKITDRKLISDKNKGTHLKDSINYEIGRIGNFGYELKLFFPDYGRFIEIRYHTGSGRISQEMFNRKRASDMIPDSKKKLNTVFGGSKVPNAFNNTGRKKYKDTRWYSKPTYSSLNGLIGELMYGMTDQVQEMLKNQLNEPL